MLRVVARTLRVSDFSEKLTEAEFRSLLGEIENETVDFKVQPPANFANTIAAMAMTDGGVIVLGVSDDRTLKGYALTQSALDTVMRAAHSCGVDVQLREVRVGRHPITLVSVPEIRGRIITTADGRLLRRIGSDNQPLIGDALARFVAERTNRSTEEDAAALVELDDFDLDLVNRALTALDRTRTTKEGVLRALVDLGVAIPSTAGADPIITNAAVLLFARHPKRHIAGATVQLVRRTGVGPGPGPTRVRQELEGPIPRILDDVITFIEANTAQHEAVVGRRRARVPEYPEAVVREAVLNALAHRDYGLAGATIDITTWDDRIEVHSPGPLPGHITLENIREEHYSRNRRVMGVLKALGLVEEYGEGVDRMFREMETRLLEPPLFTATPTSVTVTLRSRSPLDLEDQTWLALVGHYDLSAQERRVLVMAKREGSVTRRRIRAELRDADVRALLAQMVTKGLLVRKGERGGATYVLSDEVVLRAGAAGLEARSRQRQSLLDELRRKGSLSTTEALSVLGENNILLARHLLNDLVRAGVAVARGETRARRYYLAE